MTAETFRRRSDHGVTCNKCGISLIAPEWSYDFTEEQLVINLWSCTNCGWSYDFTEEQLVINLWSCTNCGNQFETEASAIEAWSNIDNKAFEESLALVA